MSDYPPYQAPEASHRFVLDSVRETDRDRFLATLFAPEPARRDLLALLAFDHELARLAWWREAAVEAAGTGQPRAQPIVDALSEAVRRQGLAQDALIALIEARGEEIEGPLDVLRTGGALADLQLGVLGVNDAPTREAAHAVGAAWLMGEGPERASLLAEARALRNRVDLRALPILLPALALDRPLKPWRTPLAYWWAARRRRY